jgi:long-chain acyl-CoA synthetase
MADEVIALSAGMTIIRLARLAERVLAENDLSPGQYRMLVQLGAGAEASSTLAKKLAVSAPSVTAVVDGLVRRGVVERFPSEEDRRRVSLQLTDAGRALLATAESALLGRLETLAHELGNELLTTNVMTSLSLWGEAFGRERARRAAVRSDRAEEASQ